MRADTQGLLFWRSAALFFLEIWSWIQAILHQSDHGHQANLSTVLEGGEAGRFVGEAGFFLLSPLASEGNYKRDDFSIIDIFKLDFRKDTP